MSHLVDQEIRTLREHFWSARDPDGHAFAPLADAYRRKGDLDEAASLVADGLARLPEFTPGHLVASRIFRARGELEEALAALDRLLELDGENVLALLEWAELSRDTGDREGAMSGLRRLLVLDPQHLGARSMLDRLEAAEPPAPQEEAEPRAESDPALDRESEPVHEEAEPEPVMEPERSSAVPAADEPPGDDLDVFGFDSEVVEVVEETDAEVAEPGVAEPQRGIRPDDASPVRSGAEDPPELATRTMAELFVRQGFADRAVKIYARLAAADPTDEELARRLEELKAGPGRVESGAEPASPTVADAPVERTDFELGSALEPATEPAPETEMEFEVDLEPDPEPVPAGERTAATIRDLMDDLLSCRAGAVPVAVLSPEAPAEVAPEGSRLAIRVAGAVPIEDLAPGAPLRTAPKGSPAALRATEADSSSSAPVQPERGGDSPDSVAEDDDLDEFRDWLEGLRP